MSKQLTATPQDILWNRPRPIGHCEDDVRWSDTTRRLLAFEPPRFLPRRRYEAITLEAWLRGEAVTR